jgi:hypothetical protein
MFFQPWEAVGKKALAPKRNHLTASVQTGGDLVVGHTFGGVENHFGTLDLKIRQRIFSRSPAQFGFLGRREYDRERARSCHAYAPYQHNATPRSLISSLNIR